MQSLTTPCQDDLGLTRVVNATGLAISLLPNGALFAIEHVQDGRRIMINQSFGSPIADGMGRLCLRIGGAKPRILPLAGAQARCRIGAASDRFVWEGETEDISHRLCLWAHPHKNLWLWHIDIINRREETLPCDVLFIQDLGLGAPGFLMSNEAYASQYIDHHIANHGSAGSVLMGRQNLSQDGSHPWVAHGCLEGALGFATDCRQVMGPAYRDADRLDIPFGTALPSIRLQHEAACAALQARTVALAPGIETAWTFFGFYQSDHPAASSDADLACVEEAASARMDMQSCTLALALPQQSLMRDAPSAHAEPFAESAIEERYPERRHMERIDGRLLSFFTPTETHHRHIVLGDKERVVLRRHGALLRSGEEMLPSEATLCITCWMHGVFGAQLTIGNTSFQKLFSVSRDPYNITRGSGLRMLVDLGDGWRLLTVPSLFEIGLNDCRWIYRLRARTITISATVSGAEPAVQWRVSVAGAPCRFLIFGHLVLGEHEYAQASGVEIDAARKRFTFRPSPESLWGQRHPQALYYLITSTPENVEAIGTDELLSLDGKSGSGAYAVIKTYATKEFAFAVTGSMTDPQQAEWLANKYSDGVDEAAMLAPALRYWRKLTRGIRIECPDNDPGTVAIDTIFPWLVHDAMIHLTAPHGLEQYTGAAWGTRDVCQGPMELLLTLEHDAAAKDILRIVFAQQFAHRGDWPQWFMLEPYGTMRDREAHGDVIIWPLKALCDYVEATGDFAILDEPVAWRCDDTLERTLTEDPIAFHVEKLIATVRERFLPGTSLIRFGNGDWNDSLQPVDPAKRDLMVSSWTVALLYQQLRRYAEILRRAGRSDSAAEQDSLATAMRADFNRLLILDSTVAGYAVFDVDGSLRELLLHPDDRRTGISYSLLPMIRGIIADLFTEDQAQHHLALIRGRLAFPDGVRLMDRPMPYHGGVEMIFKRAESAAFFGREIGLMYVHAHLRCAEAMAVLGEADALWDALLTVNPIAVTDRLAHATLRQRNCYFSSSDAAFGDRYQASAEWERVKAATIAVDGGWRVYSSGSGLYVNMLIQHAFGRRRHFGAGIVTPCLPASPQSLRLTWDATPAPGSTPQ